MNCEEFRKKITETSDITDELIAHKTQCQKCREWLKKEISVPPEGISNEKWSRLVNNILKNDEENANNEAEKINDNKEEKESNKDNLENTEANDNIKTNSENEDKSDLEKNDSQENPDEEKTFLGYYFSGLKYGIIFGLGIVIGFSIIQNLNENKQSNLQQGSSIASDTANIASQSEILNNATNSLNINKN